MEENLLRNELNNAGLKITQPRLAILTILQNENAPLTAGEISTLLETNGIVADQATVYRILDKFTRKGLLTRFEFQEGKFRYELAGQEHHHLICEVCGVIDDFSDCNIAVLEKEIGQRKGFTVKRHSLEFYGVCRSCQR
jgi:Fur family transcriptional regulator, ferric uptake regulator